MYFVPRSTFNSQEGSSTSVERASLLGISRLNSSSTSFTCSGLTNLQQPGCLTALTRQVCKQYVHA